MSRSASSAVSPRHASTAGPSPRVISRSMRSPAASLLVHNDIRSSPSLVSAIPAPSSAMNSAATSQSTKPSGRSRSKRSMSEKTSSSRSVTGIRKWTGRECLGADDHRDCDGRRHPRMAQELFHRGGAEFASTLKVSNSVVGRPQRGPLLREAKERAQR